MRQAAACQSLPLRSDDIFVYSISQLDTSTFTALCSDDKVTAFTTGPGTPSTLWTLNTPHNGIKQAITKPIANTPALLTTGNDGRICIWDPRDPGSPQTILQHKSPSLPPAPLLSLSSHVSSPVIAAGTELASHEASIQLWDIRQPGAVLWRYTESHSDDVVDLRHHPTNPALLLSGSTDGLVNVYDSNIADEDEAVLRVFNHGSPVSHAGFLEEGVVYALSSDELCTLYRLDPDPDGEDVVRPFDDVRPLLGCDYVVDILTTGAGAWIAAGYFGQSRLDLIPLRKTPIWEFIPQETNRLATGLGEEIVRTVWIDDANDKVITGSEDNTIRIWSQFA